MSTNVTGPEGMIFAGKYRIVKLIGKGGMANVYLGVDMGSGINVAIKVLKPEYSTDEEFIRRFDTEARAVSSLNHANIVKIFGVGHEGNYRYIVQEYVEGITVKELINQNGHLDWRVAVPIVIQVGLALEYAHQNGVVHRDIKPQNILISRERIAKVTDFGIARASTNSTITMTSGGAMGSVHYFSPEQARGGNVGPSSDIYSVGAMLFEMVTGRVPFDGDSNVAIAVKHLQEKVPMASAFVPGIPVGLDAIINKCMQKTPERRYISMRAMVTELDSLLIEPNGVYGVIDTNFTPEEDSNVSFRQDPNYEKISDIEKAAEARRISRIRDNLILILIIVAIIGFLIGMSILVIKALQNTSTQFEQTTDYKVENYIGEKIETVEEKLKAYKINYKVQYQESDDVETGTIIGQSIAEGMYISSQSTVSELILTVATAAESFTLSDYAGVEYSTAYESLNKLGLQPSIKSEASEDVKPGIVIRTEPEAGSIVNVGDSVVIIHASEPTNSSVPDILGQTLKDARKMLKEANLVVGKIDGDPEILKLDEKKQYIMAADPIPGSTVPRKSSVKLIVGSRNDMENGGTPTPTPPLTKIKIKIEGGKGKVTGAGEYAPGTQITLTAEPKKNHAFVCWKDEFGNTIAVSNTYTFRVGENDSTYTAVFERIENTPTPVPETTTTTTTKAPPPETTTEAPPPETTTEAPPPPPETSAETPPPEPDPNQQTAPAE